MSASRHDHRLNTPALSCRLALAVLLIGSVPAAALGADEPAAELSKTPEYDQFLVIPLRIHLLKSRALGDVDCQLADSDVKRIVGKVNGIWHQAGIHWGLESIRREPAAREERFRVARELAGEANLGLYRVLFPDDTRSFDGLHVYYIHRLAVNGVWLGENAAVVQETAQLRPVEGGIDEPVPRVSAHELGHALGLPHRQARTNLLASGTTGTLLNADEAAKARKGADRVKGTRPVAQIRVEAMDAEERGDREKARRLWSWLAEIPGDGAATARRALERLPAERG
jgi:hypothetical protein